MEARDVVARPHLFERRDRAARQLVRTRAAVGERARLRQLAQRRHAAPDLLPPLARALALVGPGDRAEQADRVRMLGVGEELVDRRLLRLTAGVHDDDA